MAADGAWAAGANAIERSLYERNFYTGRRTAADEFLDALPVTTRWVHHHRVVWQTGQQNAPEGVGPMAHTHCSAFVAAVALMLDMYLLRAPVHSQQGLANAQADWFAGTGGHKGPTALDSGWIPLGASGDDTALTDAVTAGGGSTRCSDLQSTACSSTAWACVHRATAWDQPAAR